MITPIRAECAEPRCPQATDDAIQIVLSRRIAEIVMEPIPACILGLFAGGGSDGRLRQPEILPESLT